MKAISIFALVIALAQSALALPTPDSQTSSSFGSGTGARAGGAVSVGDKSPRLPDNSDFKSAPQDLTNPFSTPGLESGYTKDTEARYRRRFLPYQPGFGPGSSPMDSASAEATAAFRREFFDHSHGTLHKTMPWIRSVVWKERADDRFPDTN